jgi:hypothetical protein
MHGAVLSMLLFLLGLNEGASMPGQVQQPGTQMQAVNGVLSALALGTVRVVTGEGYTRVVDGADPPPKPPTSSIRGVVTGEGYTRVI